MTLAAKCTCGWGGYCDGQKSECKNRMGYSPLGELKIPEHLFQTNLVVWVPIQRGLPDETYANERGEIFVIGTLEYRVLWLLFDLKDNTFHIPFPGGEVKPTHWLNVRLPKIPK